jgi:exosortase/archaeosortase family protein
MKRSPHRKFTPKAGASRTKPASSRAEFSARMPAGTTRYLLVTVTLMALLYGVYYYPYADDGFAGRLLDAYLRLQTAVAARFIWIFDPTTQAVGTSISGRFPIRIVKDCSSLDAQALLMGAVLAFPVRWGSRLIGVIAGSLALNTFNLARIAALYFVGVHRPREFDTIHEEVMPLLLIVAAACLFIVWAGWAQSRERTAHAIA